MIDKAEDFCTPLSPGSYSYYRIYNGGFAQACNKGASVANGNLAFVFESRFQFGTRSVAERL
jgi:hypothetical protein